MSTPAAKRRRIDTGQNVLLRPFRSPFKTTPNPVQDNNIQTRNDISKPSQIKTDGIVNSTEERRPATPSNGPSITKKAIVSTISASLNSDPDVAPLLNHQRELDSQLRELSKESDVAEQARKIEADSERKNPGGLVDAELLELIQKWRNTSRQAAEELFSKVRDRVNRLGGPRAWKDMQKNQHEFWNRSDDEPKRPDPDEEGEQVGETGDLYADYGVDPETVKESEAANERGLDDEGEEDEFTIAMMLKLLNVDLDVIGYDKHEQRWTD